MSPGIDTELSKSTYLFRSETAVLHILAQDGMRQQHAMLIRRFQMNWGIGVGVWTHAQHLLCIPPRMPLFFFYYLPVLEVVQSCQTFTSTAARLFQSSSMETTEGSKSLSPGYSYFWRHIQIRETVNMHVHIGHQIQISCLISNLSNKFSSQSTSQYQYGTAHRFCFAATIFMHFWSHQGSWSSASASLKIWLDKEIGF